MLNKKVCAYKKGVLNNPSLRYYGDVNGGVNLHL